MIDEEMKDERGKTEKGKDERGKREKGKVIMFVLYTAFCFCEILLCSFVVKFVSLLFL